MKLRLLTGISDARTSNSVEGPAQRLFVDANNTTDITGIKIRPEI